MASLNRSGKRALELARCCGEGFDLLARPLAAGLETRPLLPPFAGLRDPLLGPLECQFVHGGKATLAVG